jgi:hypothetical protein
MSRTTASTAIWPPSGDKTALIFEADDGAVTKVTYKELHARVCQFANGLKSLGVVKGDRVIVYMPMSIEAWWRCRPVRASARSTRWCSAAFPPRACSSASRMPRPS